MRRALICIAAFLLPCAALLEQFDSPPPLPEVSGAETGATPTS